MGFSESKGAGGVTVVQVDGQLIIGNRHELKDLIQAALERGERRLLVDFSRTGYIDSSGLGALVSISKRVREASGELRLSGLNDDLRSLFELTKLDTLCARPLVALRFPGDVNCMEEGGDLVPRHCLAGHEATRTTQFRLRVVLS